ncbi:MAG: hypothetical protein Q9223_003367 [Gallowayella weberi]
MASLLKVAFALLPILSSASPLTERACSTRSSVIHTFYGYPDNDPPGPATAYNCGGRNNVAGGKQSFTSRYLYLRALYLPFIKAQRETDVVAGSGTYSNPLTFASAPGEFNSCEVIYVPYLKKYARFEDYCAQCSECTAGTKFRKSFTCSYLLISLSETDWQSGKYHIDLWTGSSTVNGGSNQIQCENNLTPNAQSIVRQPPNNLPVDCTYFQSLRRQAKIQPVVS